MNVPTQPLGYYLYISSHHMSYKRRAGKQTNIKAKSYCMFSTINRYKILLKLGIKFYIARHSSFVTAVNQQAHPFYYHQHLVSNGTNIYFGTSIIILL